jgi:hypothetical protein
MGWTRLGRILDGDAPAPWAVSHAALPVAVPEANGLRVWFCARDAQSRARIGSVSVDPSTWRAGGVDAVPALDLGPPGAFDDSGVTSSWVVRQEGREYHYYTGWTVGVSVPFYFYVGLAIAEGGGPLRRVSAAPILERSDVDPYLTASPCVMVEGGVWRMWYVSGVRWTIEEGRPRHYYHIKYAESEDGIAWKRDGRVCIDFASAGEHAIARPSVVRDGNIYRMWYSYRGDRYRIGYAESADGLSWTRRDDDQGLAPAGVGWDSEMCAYGYVFDHAGRRYMLYNGNGYGRTGFGVAVRE